MIRSVAYVIYALKCYKLKFECVPLKEQNATIVNVYY